MIGIIALLISILLPSLNAARRQAETIKCLSNMRQLGVAAAAYTSQNKGQLLPADVVDARYPVALPYQDYAETWATILVADGFLTYPDVTSTTLPPGLDNVLRCPSGVLEMSAVTFGDANVPSSRTDGRGAMGVLHTSTRLKPDAHLFSWYGINGSSSSTDGLPFRRVRIQTNGTVAGYRKSSDVSNPADMVFLFDGLLGLNYHTTNANRINARHGNAKITNFAFVDGHAESIRTKDLPGGDGNANPAGTTFDRNNNLKKYPYPRWRIDQQ